MRGNPESSLVWTDDAGSIPAHAGQPVTLTLNLAKLPVYPRACGATKAKAAKGKAQQGLSPRMRGNRRRPLPFLAAIGSIPAHAGQPGLRPPRSALMAVYPRACGATITMEDKQPHEIGLSPRMRGNPQYIGAAAMRLRSIPAHAGQPRLP